MANAFTFPDLPGYVNDSGNEADHATQMNAGYGSGPSASADATAQQAMWTAWGIIIGSLVLLWVLGWVFKGE